jgi:hypothetical protein
MSNQLISKLRMLAADMKDEEALCRKDAIAKPEMAIHYRAYESAISLYRVRLETLIESESSATRPVIIEQR